MIPVNILFRPDRGKLSDRRWWVSRLPCVGEDATIGVPSVLYTVVQVVHQPMALVFEETPRPQQALATIVLSSKE